VKGFTNAKAFATMPWQVYVQLPHRKEISLPADDLMTVQYLIEEALLKTSHPPLGDNYVFQVDDQFPEAHDNLAKAGLATGSVLRVRHMEAVMVELDMEYYANYTFDEEEEHKRQRLHEACLPCDSKRPSGFT
jgi:hypothetical protein